MSLADIKREVYRLLGIVTMWRLYEESIKALGTDLSPQDEVPDEVACASSLSRLIQRAAPHLNFPHLVSTRQLFDYFEQSPSFKPVQKPQYGDIVLSVTGTGSGRIKNGHCGIRGKFQAWDSSPWIMSNDSRNGLWTVNFTLNTWIQYYETRGGMKTFYYTMS